MHRVCLYLMCLLVAVLVSCVNFKKAGREAAEGAFEKLDAEVPGLVGRSGTALRDSVLNQDTYDRLDSLVTVLLQELTTQAETMRDSVLGPDMEKLLSRVMSLFGDSAEVYSARIRDELLGQDTRTLLSAIRGDLLGDSTRADVKALRDELLGPATQNWIQAAVDSGMTTLIQRYRRDLKPELEKQIGFVQKHATKLLILAGIIAIVIIWFIWRQRLSYARMLHLVTLQIHNMPNQSFYDELTGRIRHKAREFNLEASLRKVLAKQQILGEENWVPPKTPAS